MSTRLCASNLSKALKLQKTSRKLHFLKVFNLHLLVLTTRGAVGFWSLIFLIKKKNTEVERF